MDTISDEFDLPGLIERYMAVRGRNLAQAAEDAGVDRSILHRIMTGERGCHSKTLIKILREFGPVVSLAESGEEATARVKTR